MDMRDRSGVMGQESGLGVGVGVGVGAGIGGWTEGVDGGGNALTSVRKPPMLVSQPLSLWLLSSHSALKSTLNP